MKYKYLIKAEGDVDELVIKEKLENLGMSVILVEKTMEPKKLVEEQDDNEIENLESLWMQTIEQQTDLSSKLKAALIRIGSERTIKSMRDIAQAVYDCCEELELSDAFSAQLIKCVLTGIER